MKRLIEQEIMKIDSEADGLRGFLKGINGKNHNMVIIMFGLALEKLLEMYANINIEWLKCNSDEVIAYRIMMQMPYEGFQHAMYVMKSIAQNYINVYNTSIIMDSVFTDAGLCDYCIEKFNDVLGEYDLKITSEE